MDKATIHRHTSVFFPRYLLLACLFVIVPVSAVAQQISAGQTTGASIIYHDIDDLFISSPYWNSWDEETIDLNDDTVNDLGFYTNFIYYSHTGNMSAAAGADPYGEIEYSAMEDNPSWIRKHAIGDAIDNKLDWQSEEGLLYRVYDSKGIQGGFSGEGYMAYRICSYDTIYGWIRLSTDVSLNGATIVVYEFAYSAIYTGLPPAGGNHKDFLVHTSAGSLNISIHPACEGRAFKVRCYDLTGRLVFQQALDRGLNAIDIIGYRKGIYLLKITDGGELNLAFKTIF